MIDLLIDYVRTKTSPKNYPTASAAAELAYNFHEDLSMAMIQFSPHNVIINQTPCLDTIVPSMVKDNYYKHFFCSCKDPKCYVNSAFARIILVSMHYLTEVLPVKRYIYLKSRYLA